MLKMRNELLEFAEKSHSIATISALVDEFADVVDRQGFESFIMTGLPTAGYDVEPLVIANRWPEGWTSRYREQAYFADDPVSKWSMTKVRPFKWSDAWHMHMETDRVRQINGEAASFGVRHGIAYPLRSIGGWQAVISLASAHPLDIGPGGEALLHTASIYFHMRAMELMSGSRQVAKLTPRECEILRWTAVGKSAWEIGEVLSLSEDTVKNHLRAIRAKFDVATTLQAVMIALRTAQIQP